MELPSLSEPTKQAVLQISWSPDNSYIGNETRQKSITFLLCWVRSRIHYWQFLEDRARCGDLYPERAKCYTRIVHSWLLFLEAPPDSKADSLDHEECRKIVSANWSRMLSKCVPGDKDLIYRLRDFTLDNAYKEDVERVIGWLVVSILVIGLSFIGYIYLRNVLQMGSHIPKGVLTRWKTYRFRRYSLRRRIWDSLFGQSHRRR